MKKNALPFGVRARAEGKTQRQQSHATCTPPKCMRNRHAILIMLISAVGYLASASFALSEPAANRIAEDSTMKAKGKDGECMDYAIAPSSKLQADRIHGRLIFYRWHIRDPTPTR